MLGGLVNSYHSGPLGFDTYSCELEGFSQGRSTSLASEETEPLRGHTASGAVWNIDSRPHALSFSSLIYFLLNR